MFRIFILLFLTLSATTSFAQINAYARVTAINTGTRTLTLSNVNETYHTFENGDQIIIMQMQDNVIGTNTTNNSSFGTIASIGSAGLFEVLTISSMTPATGTPTTITVTTNLANTYSTGVNARVQIISFRLYGSPDYTLTAARTALAWNGDIGGVIALRVAGRLIMANGSSISASGRGFRGGARSTNFYSNTMADCYPGVYASNSVTQSGAKGEGIYNSNGNANYANGRARIANGGGGGSHINAGGGGGGNYTSGGGGGAGWTCPTPASGDGGTALQTYIGPSRIFMGGGGGGGQQNDSNGSAGGNGGGIVLIKANEVRTNNTCNSTGRLITANGDPSTNTSNDGAGGGGAGGSIVFQVPTWGATNACNLGVRANGADGGDVSDGTAHGGGGGGGQGRIIYSSTEPNNVNNQTNNGASGCNNGPCSTSASPPGGTNGAGISDEAVNTALPVSLLYFNATYEEAEKKVALNWATATEKNNRSFVVEKSTTGKQFYAIAEIDGAGTTNVKQTYGIDDFSPFSGVTYYRLKQIDVDDVVTYFDIVSVRLENVDTQLELYPNPANQGEVIYFRLIGEKAFKSLELLDAKGILQPVNVQRSSNKHGMTELNPEGLKPGVYILKVHHTNGVVVRKIFVR